MHEAVEGLVNLVTQDCLPKLILDEAETSTTMTQQQPK